MITALTRLIPYTLSRYDGYVIRDAPVDPAQLPEPVRPDRAEIANLVRAAFPENSVLADSVLEHGVEALQHITSEATAKSYLNLGDEDAKRLVAAITLGRKLFAPPIGTMPLIRNAEDVAKHCSRIAHLKQEHMHILLVNNRYQLVHEETIAIGDQNGLHISPRDVVYPAFERQVGYIVLVHNHPSGDPTPSTEDIAFTKRVQEAAAVFDIQVLDHVILAGNAHASILQ